MWSPLSWSSALHTTRTRVPGAKMTSFSYTPTYFVHSKPRSGIAYYSDIDKARHFYGFFYWWQLELFIFPNDRLMVHASEYHNIRLAFTNLRMIQRMWNCVSETFNVNPKEHAFISRISSHFNKDAFWTIFWSRDSLISIQGIGVGY